MLCPYHLSELNYSKTDQNNRVEYKCKECGEIIPALYVENYNQYPPVVVNAIGFRGHGKTVFFSALFYLLRSELSRVWRSFCMVSLNEDSLETVNDNVEMLRHGELPNSTPKNFPRPTIVRIEGIPYYPKRTMLFYDTSGEAFEKATQLVQYASFVKYSKTAMLLISIPELKDVPGEMHNLLNTYIIGMSQLGARTNNQELIVIYTKADELGTRLTGYSDISDYLTHGIVDGLRNLKGYIRKAILVSEKLESFTRNVLNANAFVNLANTSFRKVRFCVVSALGSAPKNQKLTVQISPKRIFDPIIWLMESSLHPLKQKWRQTFG